LQAIIVKRKVNFLLQTFCEYLVTSRAVKYVGRNA
jgi:hypothetical protein